jgi:hypothetical protein
MSVIQFPTRAPAPHKQQQRDTWVALARELYPHELSKLLLSLPLKTLSRREARERRALAWRVAGALATQARHAREQQSCQQEDQMAALDGRPVQTKQQFAAEQQVQKAARKAERGVATKQRVLDPDKEPILDLVREQAKRDGIDPAEVEAFLDKKQTYPAITLQKHLLTWFAEWKLSRVPRETQPNPQIDDQDYAAAWTELGARSVDTGKWSGAAVASARLAARSYRKHPSIDWTQTRAIVAALGTCAWLAHIAHLDGDTIHVLAHDWQESAIPCPDVWATYVARDLSKLVGRTLKGVPCAEARVGYNRRTCR